MVYGTRYMVYRLKASGPRKAVYGIRYTVHDMLEVYDMRMLHCIVCVIVHVHVCDILYVVHVMHVCVYTILYHNIFTVSICIYIYICIHTCRHMYVYIYIYSVYIHMHTQSRIAWRLH